MSNEVSVDKIKVGLAIKAKTRILLEKLAKKNGRTWNDEAVAALERATQGIKLSSEDEACINILVAKNEARRAAKRRKGT